MTIKNIVSGQLPAVTAYSNTTGVVSGIAPAFSNLGGTSNVTISGGTNGQVLTTDGNGGMSWSSVGGIPGGSNTQVQFNNSGAFGGSANLTFNGNTLAVIGNITATANVSGNLAGNGARLFSLTGANITGQVPNALVAGTVYANAQPNITSTGTLTALTVTGNITGGNIATGGQVVAAGNVTANYFIGNGSQLTGMPAAYSNTTANAFLAAGLVGNIIPTGNSTQSLGNVTNQWASLYISNSALYMNGIPITLNSNNTLVVNGVPVIQGGPNNVSNIATTGNISGAKITAAGNITANTGYFFIGDGSQLSNLQPIPGNTLVNGNSNVVVNANANVVVSVTGISNVASFNVNGLAVANTVSAGNIRGTNVSAGTGNIFMSGNTLATTNANMVIDAGNDGTPAGNVTVLGSLNVLGTLSYNDIGNTITNDLVWIAANSAGSLAAANGAGLAFGPNGTYGNFTYNNSANVWSASLGITASGNITATGNVTGNYIIGNGSSLTALTGANVTGQVPNALVASTVYTNAQPNITSVGTLTTLAVSGTATAGHFTGEGGNLSNIQAANIVGSIPLTVTVSGNAQPNVTSLGTLTSLSVSGSTATGNLTANTTITANGNVTVGGSGELVVTTDNDHGGANYAGIMTMTNTNIGVTNPNKFLRISPVGDLQILNSAYSATILDLTDSGNLTIPGSFIGDGTGVRNVTAPLATNIAGGSAGYIPYQTATNTTNFITSGTTGQVLVSQGTGSPPKWADLGSGTIPRAYSFSVSSDQTIAGVLSNAGISEVAGMTITLTNTTNTGTSISFPGLTNYDTVGGGLAPTSNSISLGFNASVTVQCYIPGTSYTIMGYTGSSYQGAFGQVFSGGGGNGNRFPVAADTIIPYQGMAHYDNIDMNNNGWIDVPNHRFTPNLSGYWLITATLTGQNQVVGGSGIYGTNIQIRKNDQQIAIATGLSFANKDNTLTCSTVVYLNGAGDYVNVTGYSDVFLYLNYTATTLTCTLIK